MTWRPHSQLGSKRRGESLKERQRRFRIPGARSMLTRNCSTAGDAALHRAMNPGLQKGNLGLAVKRPERRFQQPGAKARFPDLADRRTFGLVPGNVEAIVRH